MESTGQIPSIHQKKGFTLLMIVKQLNLLTSTVVCQRGSQW